MNKCCIYRQYSTSICLNNKWIILFVKILQIYLLTQSFLALKFIPTYTIIPGSNNIKNDNILVTYIKMGKQVLQYYKNPLRSKNLQCFIPVFLEIGLSSNHQTTECKDDNQHWVPIAGQLGK